MAGIKYWLWLSECRALTPGEKLELLDRFGSPEEVYYAGERELFPERTQPPELDRSLETANRILGECERLGVRVLTMQDADYPIRLRNIFEPPLLLYVRGTLPIFDEEAAIAVVGTRAATPYGIEAAEKLAAELSARGALIVSGGAAGIDSAAHRGALRAGGRTVAVLGCGVDVTYPAENAGLYADILRRGALLSEYAPGTPALGKHFPVRNRILSGLCLAVLVAEAPERSGALITANAALEQGRDVFAVPGPINADASRGCNRLIASGLAGLAAESGDILCHYEARYPHRLHGADAPLPENWGAGVHAAAPKKKQQTSERPEKPALPKLSLDWHKSGLGDDQLLVLRALRDGGSANADELIERTELSARRVSSALTVLEVEGYISRSAAQIFSLNVELTEE